MSSPKHSKGLRTVALIEASKGIVVLMLGIAFFYSWEQNESSTALLLIQWFHLNPTGNYAGRFIEVMKGLESDHLALLLVVALIYALMRLIEAYGLWIQQRWAEWFAALGGAVYIPIELYELYRHPSAITVMILLVNIAIVAYMIRILRNNPSSQTEKR